MSSIHGLILERPSIWQRMDGQILSLVRLQGVVSVG